MLPTTISHKQVDNKLLHLSNTQMDVMMRLADLSRAVELLKNKTEQNRDMAKDAKAQSVNATLEAAGLQEVRVFVCVHLNVVPNSVHIGA